MRTQHKQPNSPPAERKKRTRAHVLADLSTNHVERFIIHAGHAADRVQNDYGCDLILITFTPSGDFENGSVSLQLKATDTPVEIENGTKISFQIDRADINQWREEPMPVILIVYNAQQDKAYWLYTQEYFENSPNFRIKPGQTKVNLHISKNNLVNEAAIQEFRRYKEDVLGQIKQGAIKHHA